MDKLIKKISVQFAIIIFFIMSIASLTCRRPVSTCCVRSLTGAVVTYVVCSFAMRGIFAVVINAIAKSKED